MTVTRFLSLLVALALMMTNSVAIAAAKCQHMDSQAHISALQSENGVVAAEAISEEAAALASKQAALADAASVQLVGALMPSDPVLPIPVASSGPPDEMYLGKRLASIEVTPLLEPPSA